MKFDTIFIAGVHGVGKGYLSSRLSEVFEIDCFAASTLIKNEKGLPIDIDKVALEPDSNQDLLVRALNRIKPKTGMIILDGHFVLKGKGKLFRITEKVFERLSIKAIFLLTDSVEIIYERLNKRDGYSISINDLFSLQCAEIENAHKISENLCIPIIEGSSSDFDTFSRFIGALTE